MSEMRDRIADDKAVHYGDDLCRVLLENRESSRADGGRPSDIR